MAKEIVIELSKPADELAYLIQTLNRVLGSSPLDEGMNIVYYLPDETEDAVIRAKIEPCIGAFVKQVIINAFLRNES